MVSEYTRTGRKKLWFDLMNDAGVVVEDGDIVVLNDEAFDRVMAATNGHAAACSKLMDAGFGSRFVAGTAAYSAHPPSAISPKMP